MYKQLRITHECIVLVLISLVNNERTNEQNNKKIVGLIRGEIQQNEGVFVIFLIVKNEFLLSRFVICVTIFTSYNKGDERKRNETRFDTITVSLKAIWLVLGSVFLSLTSAAHLCRTRVFFAYV